jgi:hypothetical protein
VATVTVQIRKAYGATPDEIPASVLKSIPQAELLCRLADANELGARAARTRDPVLAEAYTLRARAVLAARPRDEVAKEIARRYQQAGRTQDPAKAEALRSSAMRLIEENPPARTREEVAKAKKADPEWHAVFDGDGTLIGVCDAADIQPLTDLKPPASGSEGTPPSPDAAAGTPADVAKAARAARTPAPRATHRPPRPTAPHAAPSAAVVTSACRNARTAADGNAEFDRLNAAAIAGLDIIHRRGVQARRHQ